MNNPRVKDRSQKREPFVWVIDRSLVHIRSGTSFFAINNDPIMIKESKGWHPIVAQNYFGLPPSLNSNLRVLNNVSVIGNPGNYFHWFTEEFIRFQKTSDINDCVAHISLPTYARESLASLGIFPLYIQDSWAWIEKQYMITRKPYEDLLREVKYDVVGRAVLNYLPPCHCHEGDSNDRIYISRSKSKRPLPNESSIEAFLVKQGFKVHYFEELDFGCQVTLANRAKILAGAHGAGLTNILWLPSTSFVVEFMPPDFYNPCYSELAANLELRYFAIDMLEREHLFDTLAEILRSCES